MNYTVEIGETEIASSGCPIERAINTQTPLGAHVGANGKMTLWAKEWDGPREIAIAYARALDFIKRRDNGKTVKPFSFSFSFDV